MNHLDSLTTWEKIMNMAKLGIVSRAGNYFSTLGNPRKQRAGGLMRYTLCVFQGKARRNGSRNGFTVSPMNSAQTIIRQDEMKKRLQDFSLRSK